MGPIFDQRAKHNKQMATFLTKMQTKTQKMKIQKIPKIPKSAF